MHAVVDLLTNQQKHTGNITDPCRQQAEADSVAQP